jgi:hypothetical protein
MEKSPPILRVYRPKWWWRTFSLFFPAFGACAVVSSIHNYESQTPALKPGVLIVGLLFVIIGSAMVLQAFMSHLRFIHDAVEHRTLFHRKSLPLTAILGRTEYTQRDSDGVATHYIRLIPTSDQFPTIEFTTNYNLDDAFFRWFDALPVLDDRHAKIKNSQISGVK